MTSPIGRDDTCGYSCEPVAFSALSNYEYELPDPLEPSSKAPTNVIPASVKALNGKMVSLEGFMLPLDLTPEGVSVFMLNASLDLCYFGAPVRMNEWVLEKMKHIFSSLLQVCGVGEGGKRSFFWEKVHFEHIAFLHRVWEVAAIAAIVFERGTNVPTNFAVLSK